MAVVVTQTRRADDMAREIVDFVRERYDAQDERVVLDSLWLAFQSVYGPFEASRTLRAYLFQ